MLIRKNMKQTSIDYGKKFLLFLCFVLQIKQWVLALSKLGWWKMHPRKRQVKIKIFINQKILFQFLLLIYHIWYTQTHFLFASLWSSDIFPKSFWQRASARLANERIRSSQWTSNMPSLITYIRKSIKTSMCCLFY